MRARLLGVVSVIAVLSLWEFVGRFIVKEKIFLVPFSEVMVYLVRWAVAGDLGRNIAASAQAFGIGFALAIVIGVSLGIAIGLNATIRGLADPLVAALYSTPLLALTPLFILWLGIGLASKVAIIMLVSVFPIVINTTAGVREVETQYLDVARSFGARPRQMLAKVRLPTAVPFILAGIRISVARAVVGVFVAELLGGTVGIGYAISSSASVFDTRRMFAGIVLLAGFGILATQALVSLERWIAPWRAAQDKGAT